MTHAEEPDDRGPDSSAGSTGAEPAGPAQDDPAQDDPAQDDEADTAETAKRADEERAAQRWVEDLVERGEAVPENEDTDIPPGATHEVVEGDDGPTRVRRRRFPIA